MLKPVFLLLSCLPLSVCAQQFVGSNNSNTIPVGLISQNPAWTASAVRGTELQLFSFSALAGTNAYRFSKGFVNSGFSGEGVLGADYYKDQRLGTKYVWANIDVLGPAVSFRINESVAIGGYVRIRSIVRGGDVNNKAFQSFGSHSTTSLADPIRYAGAGFSTHTFSEIAFSYGRVLGNDFYHLYRGGFNLKYIMGMSAGSVYTDEILRVSGHRPDTVQSMSGDLQVSYSKNIAPFIDGDIGNQVSSWFQKNGRGGIGIDIGMQYEYHPEGNPNIETPYKVSLAVSITDIGSVRYSADTFGSAKYGMHINHAANAQYMRTPKQPYIDYLYKLQADSMLIRESMTTSFSMGLPTALRINFDWNAAPHVYLASNILLNLKGSSGGIYNSGYVNMLNITPRYQHQYFSVAMPFTYIGYQMLTVGAAIQIGPIYAGSSSLISTMIARQVNAIDGYLGITVPLQKEKLRY